MLTLSMAQDAVTDAYRRLSRVAESLGDADFLRPTLCAGWATGDILFHVLTDAQRALVTLASPAPATPDVDFVTYWKSWSPGDPGALIAARAVRIGASAFPAPRSLVNLWIATSEAALRMASQARPDEFVTTQGHILGVRDFLATLAVEATIHHLDMTAYLGTLVPPSDIALKLVRVTLDGLLGTNLPAGWGDSEYALKGTGRIALSATDRSTLGRCAARFPLFG